jgi:hypothetical protein
MLLRFRLPLLLLLLLQTLSFRFCQPRTRDVRCCYSSGYALQHDGAFSAALQRCNNKSFIYWWLLRLLLLLLLRTLGFLAFWCCRCCDSITTAPAAAATNAFIPLLPAENAGCQLLLLERLCFSLAASSPNEGKQSRQR